MKNPWLKFYPSDWRADPALRMCTLEARGLWMDMLCIMHEAEPYGHLLINGHAVTDTQLAALTGTDASTVARLKTELETAGVFSRSGKGAIYSRRMTRDYKKAKHAKAIGKTGGNPSLSKPTDISAQDNPPDNPDDNGEDNTQRPETRPRDQKGLKDPKPVPVTARARKPASPPAAKHAGSFQQAGSLGPVGSGSGSFDIRNSFSEKDWGEVSLALRDYVHPDWDRKIVFEKYNAYVANDPPKKPVAAFTGWLKKNAKWLGRAP